MPLDINQELINQTPGAPGSGQGGGAGGIGNPLSGLGAMAPGGPMSGLGLLAGLLMGKDKPPTLAITPGTAQGSALPGGAGGEVMSAPTYTQTAPGGSQGGLLAGLGNGLVNSTGLGSAFGLAGMAGKALGFDPSSLASGGIVGSSLAKLLGGKKLF
jgi:hypothetical protein